MEGHCSTGQSPQWAVAPMEEEEDKYELKEKYKNAVKRYQTGRSRSKGNKS